MMADAIFVVSGAGRWFPAAPKTLQAEIDGYLAQADIAPVRGALLGGIVPHAGLDYSGRVAGHTYAALRAAARVHGHPASVIVLGFSHRPAAPGLALLDADTIQTPLGLLPVDRAGVDHLLQAVPGARLDCASHVGEHSVENQFPFLQCALPGVPVVAGLVCGHDDAMLQAIAAALLGLHAQRQILCVASTDLLHDASYDKVRETDKTTLDMLERLDYGGLNKAWSYAKQICCGIGPVTSLLHFLTQAGCRQGQLLCYENSGDIDPSGRGSWVVGYGAVVYPTPGNKGVTNGITG